MRIGRILSHFAVAAGVAACGPTVERVETLEPAVARLTWELRANGTDLIPVTVYAPPQPRGALVFIHGGAVAPSRYAWLGVELARRGLVVAMPRHPSDLAFFGIDFGQRARGALVDPLGSGLENSVLQGAVDAQRVAVAGHSLGGVVAMKLATQGGFAAAALQASFPDPADDAKVRALSIPTLSLAGALDCQAKVPQVRAGWEALPSPTALVVLEGVTHFQFTESDAEDGRRGCAGSTSLEDAHRRIADTTAAFLDEAFARGGVAADALSAASDTTAEVR